MRKILTLFLFSVLLSIMPARAVEATFTMADEQYGLVGGENLVELSPLQLNEDIQIVFEKGNTEATFNKSGYAQVPINSTIYIKGATEDVKIYGIDFTITANSYRFYVDSTETEPKGTLTWDADTKTNSWSYDEGSNVVKFPCNGTVRFTAIKVNYTGGKLGGNTGGSDSENNEPVEFTFTMADEQYGLVGGENLVELSPLQLNEDIQLVFEKGNADATYNKSGYAQVPINSMIYVKGATEDVKIFGIDFTITANSYRFYVDSTTTEPEGTFTWDADTKTNSWSYDEGANVVKFVCDGTVRFTAIKVNYTGGKLGSNTGSGSENQEPVEFTFTMADEQYGLVGGENLVELSPLQLNEDIQLVFEKGNADATYNKSGYAQVPINSTIYVKGATEEVKITEIKFAITANSYRFYVDSTTREPEGTFTWDADTKTNTWSYDEGANAVKFVCDGTVRFTAISVKYSGGKAQGGNPGGDDPDQPDPEHPADDNLLSTGFDTSSEWNQFTVINVQEGSNTWKWSSGNPYGKVENDLGNTTPKDDYLVTPALTLKAGLTYRLTFDTWCGAPNYPETIAAYLLTDNTKVDGKKEIIGNTEITNDTNNKRQLEGTFSVETDGTYYVAIHAASAPGMHYLYADNIEVSRGVGDKSPAQVSDLLVAPSPLGENSVTLSFTAPTLCLDGTTPLSDLKSVIISRDGAKVAELEATPGQQLTYTDNVEKAGNYKYAVTASAASGKSLDSKASVYVGIYRPADVANLTVEEVSPGTVKLSWQPVTTNIYGHTIDESLVTYRILEGLYTTYKDKVEGNSITIDYVAPTDPQKIVTFAIKALTSAGESANPAVAETVAVGTPYAMPFAETFSDAEMDEGHTAEFVEDPSIPGIWWRCFESSGDVDPATNDNGFLGFISNFENTSSTFRTGKIHVDENASNPYLAFYYHTNPESKSTLTLSINKDEIETIQVGAQEKGWHEKVVNLASYKGQDIRVAFEAVCLTPGITVAIDNITVRNEANDDMAITRARIPYEMIKGEDHTCNIKVENLGINPSGAYTLTVKADGEVVESINGTSLQRGETAEHEIIISPEALPGEKAIYTVTLACQADENPSDNEKEIEVSVRDEQLPSPAGLHFVEGKLLWDAIAAKDFPVRKIEETFEAYDEFEIDKAGEWQFFDGDQYPTRGMENPFLKYPNMYAPMAFMVFNNHDGRFPSVGSASMDAYEGGQCMVSAAADWTDRDKIPNNDWMISPELSGEPQTISLYARSRSMVFPETFQILYTTGEDALNTAAYTKLEQYDEIGNTWEKYSVQLPAGAKYFAIRNVSDDRYYFLVDNVSFEAAPKLIEVSGYNVYTAPAIDGEWKQINEALLTDPEIAIAETENGNVIRVEAIFANGVSTSSEPINVDTTGINNIESAVENPEYYTLDGLRLQSAPTQPGIYIVRDSRGTRKIVVR